ncbi:hypothetical protein M409DRAFT_59243 [Zasmidium cellare ATCC 36951]|uniref:WAP domain-containing protein n=1 Tax=Zasmidium cellare ATCC 36951 TaxID=1080233 RepID=A0A6A6C4P7_ZASCE|nr:uncharacterized protein M409DRAFT_59243 [Zasmidium cellare ATCC 36951]KAF2161238.1 hypothetical protein M409DRAFT_59243 [Zasmidium cellare ATCC 36951]
MNFLLLPLAALMSMLSLGLALPPGTSPRFVRYPPTTPLTTPNQKPAVHLTTLLQQGSLIQDDGPSFPCYDITCIPGPDGDAQCANEGCTEGCIPTASKCGT